MTDEKTKPLFSKKFKKTATKKFPMPLWLLLGVALIAALFLGLLINMWIQNERKIAVEEYKVVQEKQSLMKLDLDDLKEWGMKKAIIMGVYGAPVALFLLWLVLVIHGFKVVGR